MAKETAFTHEQYESIYPEGIENHYWNHARNRIILKYLQKHLPSFGKILEIGCGKGVVVDYLRQHGVDCYGADLAEVHPIEKVKDYIYPGVDAFTLPLEFRDSIETILLLDVIEHIEKPLAFLQNIRKFFPGVTHLLITVPARKELWSNYDEFAGHCMRYVPGDIIKFNGPDMGTLHTCYFNHILYPFFFLLTRVVKSRNTHIKTPQKGMVTMHRFLSWILRMDYQILPCQVPGTSVIALIRFNRP